jgi:LmbE family N-acetylglucosaminyl deacetylase
MKKILVIAAHPDDEILGCGGTLLNHIGNGDEVYVTILGEGSTSRYKELSIYKDETVDKLRSSAKKVADFMGWKKLFMFSVADNRFDSVDLLDIIKIIEGVKDEVKPDLVYTHHFGDLNIDHRITHDAVLSAFRPLKGESCRRILTFEIPSSTEWGTPASHMSFIPTVYVDISKTVKKKCDAMAFYESEFFPFPHPRSPRALMTIAERWGINVGMEYAEAFALVRELL